MALSRRASPFIIRPNSPEFETLVADNFTGFGLHVDGLAEQPREFSLAELRAMPKQEQITTHFCIRGWSGVTTWGGVPMHRLPHADLTPCTRLLSRSVNRHGDCGFRPTSWNEADDHTSPSG